LSGAAEESHKTSVKAISLFVSSPGDVLPERDAVTRTSDAALSELEDTAEVQLSSLPGPQPIQSGAASRHPARLGNAVIDAYPASGDRAIGNPRVRVVSARRASCVAASPLP
jgi:hypothetical protein